MSHDPELERALRDVPHPEARPQFRTALRERFLSVEAASDAGVGRAPHGSARSAAPPHATPQARQRSGLRLVLGALAAAALVVFVVSQVLRQPPSVWRVLEASGQLVVDGKSYEAVRSAELERALLSASSIETRGGSVRLVLRDEVLIELGDNTRLSQMRFPAAGAYSLHADSGALRIATGPGFPGRGLRVATVDMHMSVEGTLFGLDVDEQGTCLCCLEGRVAAEVSGSARPGVPARQDISARGMGYVFRATAQEPMWGSIKPMHEAPLIELQAFARAHFDAR